MFKPILTVEEFRSRKKFLVSSLFLFVLLSVPQTSAGQPGRDVQEGIIMARDTLKASVKTDYRRVYRSIAKLESGLPTIRGIVSPLGEGDPIKWIQTLPGVTTGADGTSAVYVRGGNAGNNVVLLDGVPVYGFSHLAGLTTVIPQDVIESVAFSKGGFEGKQSNMTASQICVRTRNPEEFKTFVSINNFLISAGTEGKAGRLSYLVSGRLSPLTLEYRAVRNSLPGILKSFNDFSADVGDCIGKVRWEIDGRSVLDGFVLGSVDRYSFKSYDGAKDVIGWNNAIGMIRYKNDSGFAVTELQGYMSRLKTGQSQEKNYRNVSQELSLASELTEYSLSFTRKRHMVKTFDLSYGFFLKDALFVPGQVGAVNKRTNAILATAYAQADYCLPNKFSMMAALRGNAFQRAGGPRLLFSPDASVSIRWQVTDHLGFETAFDKTSQFYHTLEGLPVGWSVDMIVPAGKNVLQESALQGNVGFDVSAGDHHFSAATFYKQMDGLVYYKYAPSLFHGALAAWEENVDTGSGSSCGLEVLYEYHNGGIDAHISYTLSKTDRKGFASVNDGAPFHARFDRRHVLNASAQWMGISAAFTLQSGNWENAAPQTYEMHIITQDMEWVPRYFSSVNNYHMPTVVRVDLGYRFSFETDNSRHEVSLGVCNVFNHFNPFMLYFDAATETWNELSLLPIMPNFSYRIRF